VSGKSNSVLIGAFVVVALALLAIGIALFGGAQYFTRKSEMVAYFEGSVKGLRKGSNVLFWGVPIGYVSEIQLLGDVATIYPIVRTTLELSPRAWVLHENNERLTDDDDVLLSAEQLVEAGLRARLGTESFVTGQLVIELDFLPDTEPVLRALKDETLREIPTIPTEVQQILAELQNFVQRIDFEALVKNLQSAMAGLDELANSKDARGALSGLNQLANSQDLQQLPGTLRSTLGEVRSAAAKIGELSAEVDAEMGPLAADMATALNKLVGALDSAQSTLDTLDRQASGETGLEYELSTTLREVRDTARSLRFLTDYLQKNPEALIRGKR
jgi:paraquat-inducible protein B